MTKKTIIKILSPLLVALPVLGALTPHVARANWLMDSTFYTFFAWITQAFLAVSGWFLALTGVLLNGAMVATLNMKTIVDSTPAIGLAWRTIRDFSSIFIIFMLLYASINMILGRKDHSLGTLIKNVVIAGLLINFSLFGTKILIDASNIVSMSFYCAMAQQTAACQDNVTDTTITGAFSSVGIADVFMQKLNIQAVVSDSKTLVGGTDPHLSIALSNIGASALMVVAGISFLTAAIMFAVRIGVLILLMAFSPIYIIAIMMPGSEVASQAKKWSGALYSMCIFMPVYLFLMYIAVKIINDPHFFDFATIPSTTKETGVLTAHTVGIFLQYLIAFIFINAPLVAAISIASSGASFVGSMGKSIQKWGQGAIKGGIKGGAGFAWRESGGRAANALANNERFKDIAGNRLLGGLALKATRGVAGGYNENLEKKTKNKVAFAESLGRDETKMAAEQATLRDLKTQVAKAKADPYSLHLVPHLSKQVAAAEKRVLNIDTKRQRRYAQRTKGGLFNHVARNDAASAKVEVSVIEKKMANTKKELDDNKADLKKLESNIKNNRAIGAPGSRNYVAAGTPNPAQDAERTRLLGKVADGTRDVAQHENDISQLKLVK